MDYYCEVCDKFVKPTSKYKPFKSNVHKEFNKGEYMELILENPDINNVNDVLYAYIIQHNKEYEYYHIKCNFILVFNVNQFSEKVTSNFFDSETMNSWQNFLNKGN